MKRVCYLAGAIGIAPIAAGTLVAGNGHAAAEVTSHGKTVSLHAATGHQARTIPDINRSSCWFHSSTALKVNYINGSGYDTVSCFYNGGSSDPNIHNAISIWTGNNGMSAHITENGHTYYCVEVYRRTFYGVTNCTSANNGHPNTHGTLTWLRIFSGINK